MTLRALLLIAPLVVAWRAPAQSVSDSARLLPIAIEQRLATAARLRLGDSVGLSVPGSDLDQRGRIAAIYEPAPDPATIMRRDYHIRMHLGDLASMLGAPDRVDRIGVELQPGVEPDTAAALLNRTAFGYDVTPSRQIASQSSTTFLVVSRFHRAIALISVMASTVFLLCLMLLKVEERRRDVAMLRFTGISRRTVFLALVMESTAIALAGSLVGTGLALIASRVVNSYYRHAFATPLIFSEITARSLGLALGLSIALGVIAGAAAAWRLVRVPPIALWSRSA